MRLPNETKSTINGIIPWVIVVLMTAYVSLLSYYASHRTLPEPEFNFYNTTPVMVRVLNTPVMGEMLIQGQFNNIIEGERQIVMAKQVEENLFEVDFQVNSPRPATLFINDEAVQIFLVPDSVLGVDAVINPESGFLDSLSFTGSTKGICRYYRERSPEAGRRDIRSMRSTVDTDSLPRHAHLLDSLAVYELANLLIRSKSYDLPLWFIEFEKNEILYQKAYLKLSNAYNREIYPGYLDPIEVDNANAVFSYYYYLFLRTLIQSIDTGDAAADSGLSARRLAIADSLLSGEVRDVYLTSVIFEQMRTKKRDGAFALFQKFEGTFSRKKYERFLRKQLEESRKQPPAPLSS